MAPFFCLIKIKIALISSFTFTKKVIGNNSTIFQTCGKITFDW